MPFNESAYQRVPCTADTQVIRLSQGQKKVVDITMRDENGNALDIYELLSNLESGVNTELSSSSASGEDQTGVKLAASHTYSSTGVEFEIEGTIVDADAGQVRFNLDPAHTATPGALVASVGVFHKTTLLFQQPIYLEFMPNNFTLSTCGPLTVPEVRMDIMDMCPDANYLIDELEFTDAEIIHAMRTTIDIFNEMPPRVVTYTPETFPFRGAWLGATSGYLLKMIANRYRRNTLRYSAGGITIADQERADAYQKEADKALDMYREWCQQIQVQTNISMGYGSIAPSPYRRGYYQGGGG